ncbi:hypothetical protein [Gorillibacterium sp. sgz5001074]|uniref:hypothetical protein n=1 Tax=Gorillibacterium sp. sgz5001074 TaxID=3446695 RepID=UPI003F66C9D9
MKRTDRVMAIGGTAGVLSGLLFFAQYLFVQPVPRPPAANAELMAWVAEWRFPLAMADELLFFAALALIPAIAALYRVLRGESPALALLGCGLFAAAIPLYLVLVVILGRLVYPVYDLELTPELNKLVISLYYGGMHAVGLLLGGATLLVSLAIRNSPIGRWTAYVGIAAGVLDWIGAYPWLISGGWVFVSQLFASAWLILLGIRLLGLRTSRL